MVKLRSVRLSLRRTPTAVEANDPQSTDTTTANSLASSPAPEHEQSSSSTTITSAACATSDPSLTSTDTTSTPHPPHANHQHHHPPPPHQHHRVGRHRRRHSQNSYLLHHRHHHHSPHVSPALSTLLKMPPLEPSSLTPRADTRPQPPPRLPRAAQPPKGGIVFDTDQDKRLADRQRNSIRFVFQRLTRDIWAGAPSIRTTSMPVHLNEPRSFLQRLTDEVTYADYFLPAAAAVRDNPPLRLCLVAGLLVSGLHRSATMAKVFNPHIGETYQAMYGPDDNPTTLSLEQSRHHPPVAHFVARPMDKSYTLCGYASFDSAIRFSEQSLLTRRTGITVVDFADDDSRIFFFQPQSVVKGLLGGERRVEVSGPCALYYEKYNLVLDLLFDPPQAFTLFSSRNPSDLLHGVLYELSEGSKHVFSGAFAKHPNAFYGAPEAVLASQVESVEEDSDEFVDAPGPAGRSVLHVAGVNNVDPSGQDGHSAQPMVAVIPDPNPSVSVLPNESVSPSHAENQFSYPPSLSRDLLPIELRADRDIRTSVTSAWQATKNGTLTDLSRIDESTSLPGMQRNILAMVSGSFVSHLDVGGLRVWDLDTPTGGVRPVPSEAALPSDSRFRPDLIALQKAVDVEESMDAGNGLRNELLEKAQVAKDDLENEKRAERKLHKVTEDVHDHFFPKCLLDAITK